MSPRHSKYEPLQPSGQPRWLVIRNMHRGLLSQQLLAPGTDLGGAFVMALAAQVQAGWTLETFSSNVACAFCSRGGERCAVSIEAEDPTRPLPFRPHPGRS